MLFHSAAALKKHSGQSVGYSGVEHSIILVVGVVHTRANPFGLVALWLAHGLVFTLTHKNDIEHFFLLKK